MCIGDAADKYEDAGAVDTVPRAEIQLSLISRVWRRWNLAAIPSVIQAASASLLGPLLP